MQGNLAVGKQALNDAKCSIKATSTMKRFRQTVQSGMKFTKPNSVGEVRPRLFGLPEAEVQYLLAVRNRKSAIVKRLSEG
jgi:hypothetical protein